MRLKTAADVKRELWRHGKSVAEVSRQMGVSSRIVYELLRGRIKGRRGQAHRAAVLLGLKDGVVE